MNELEYSTEENIPTGRSFNLYDLKGQKVALGNLDYIGEKISVFSVAVFLSDDIVSPLRIESRVNYEEVYSATIDRIENNKIILDSLRNISRELKEDIKMDLSADLTIELQEAHEDEPEKLDIKLLDISSGGIAFRAEKIIRVGSIISVPLNILDFDFNVKMVVLRREILGRDYKYGCRFTELTSLQESQIRKEIYRLQIEEYRRKFGR